MSTQSKLRAKDLILLEATASRHHEPGDEHALVDAVLNVAITVEFGVTELSVHHSGREGVVTAQFTITERVSLDEAEDDSLTRENRITCAYRIILTRDVNDVLDFDLADLVADDLINEALTYAHSYFRQKLRALSDEVFMNEFSLAPTWHETRMKLDSGSIAESAAL